MSSFTLQRLVNHFPLWTKVRSDPSSLGQRMFGPIANAFEQLDVNQQRLDYDFHVEKPWLGLGTLNFLYLEQDDWIRAVRLPGGGLTYVYPTSVVGDAQTLRQVDSFEELSYGLPDRLINVTDFASTTTLVWTSGTPAVFNAIPEPDYLWMEITGSAEWLKKSRQRNRYFNSDAFIRITGIDLNDLPITQVTQVQDDGYYRTKVIFKEVTAVEYQGFDGTVNVRWASANQERYKDRWRRMVFTDYEAPLKLELSTDVVNATTETFLTASGDRYQLGKDYRRPDISDLESNEEHSSVVLRDVDGQSFTGLDSMVSPQNTYLYVLGDDGLLHIFEHHWPDFTPPTINDNFSTDNYMRLEHPCPYATYGATDKLFITNYRPRFPVQKLVVKRQDPAGAVTYLQADMSWAAGLYELTPNVVNDRVIWHGITTETTYDQLGMWEYEVTAYTEYDTTNSYSNVMVGSIDALRSIDTGVLSPTGLSLSRAGYIQVHTATRVYQLREAFDTFVADEQNQRLILREDYSNVVVTY